MDIVWIPLGWIMKFIYQFVGNYGLTLILFTVFVRLVQVPLNVKQQKNMAKQQPFNEKLKRLQKQYKNNQKKYQEEMMKLQEEEGINPMASCLPMIITMFVLFGVIDVVYKPLKHLFSVPVETIDKATKALTKAGFKKSSMPEIDIMNVVQGNHKKYDPNMFDKIFSPEVLEKMQAFDFNFLGLNLGQTPHWGLNATILIPILSGVTSLLTSIMTIRNQKKTGMQQQGSGSMNMIMYIMPIFSIFIAFSFPLGIGMYWTVGNICMLIVNAIMYRIYTPEKMKEIAEKEKKNKKKKKPSKYRQAMMAAMKEQQGGSDDEPKNEKIIIDGRELKESELTNSQRIALARKRMAEKYGDVD